MKELTFQDLEPQIANYKEDPNIPNEVNFSYFQKRAQSAITELINTSKKNPVMLLTSVEGVDAVQCIVDLLKETPSPERTIYDLCYAENLFNELAPIWLQIKSGSAVEFNTLICDLLNKIKMKIDAEDVLLKIMKKQGDNKKLEDYLSDLSLHIAQNKEFSHPILMNILVSNEANKFPVVIGSSINWKKLFGGVNYLTENGTTFSNQHLLEAGLLRKANGGYLILKVEELIRNPALWFKLKNTLESGVLDWDNPTDSLAGNVVPFFAPEPTPIDVRIILVGNYIEIAELYHFDINFTDYIYLRTDINSFFELEQQTQVMYRYLKQLAKKHNFLEFDDDALKYIIRESCKDAESQREFVINEHNIYSIMCEASGIATRQNKPTVSAEIVQNTIKSITFRLNSMVEDSSNYYKNKQLLLQTDGNVVGQINGLSVIQTMGEQFEYGEPIRITATIHNGGDGDIADIEHKADLAGQIHTKAMMIINGYLSNKFGYSESIPVSANLVFEQSYSEIDGDSASLTGLCAILSALANKPISQSFAVTGAVDQFGNVQPVGGVNKKIEGFYRLCQIQGITGKQGVIIPESNQQALILDEEIITAVKEKKFHIWTVTSVDEAIELLTGIKGGFKEKSTSSTVNEKEKTLKNQTTKEQTLFEIINDNLELSSDSNSKAGFLSNLFSALFNR